MLVIDTEAPDFQGALKAYRKGGWAEAFVYLKRLGYPDHGAEGYTNAARHCVQEHDVPTARATRFSTLGRQKFSCCPACGNANHGQHKRILCAFCGREYDGRKRRDSKC